MKSLSRIWMPLLLAGIMPVAGWANSTPAPDDDSNWETLTFTHEGSDYYRSQTLLKTPQGLEALLFLTFSPEVQGCELPILFAQTSIPESLDVPGSFPGFPVTISVIGDSGDDVVKVDTEANVLEPTEKDESRSIYISIHPGNNAEEVEKYSLQNEVSLNFAVISTLLFRPSDEDPISIEFGSSIKGLPSFSIPIRSSKAAIQSIVASISNCKEGIPDVP